MGSFEEAHLQFVRETTGATFGGWISNVDKEWLVDFLQKTAPFDVVVEVGVFMGGTSNILLYLSKCKQYFANDNWGDGDHQAKPTFNTLKEGFIKTTEWAKDRITLIEGDSIEVGKNWNQGMDLLYIDGDHSYKYAREDISNFSRFLKVGGYLLVDDYEMEGVIRATDELVTYSNKWKVIRKPNTDKRPPVDEKLFAAQKLA